MVYPFETAAYSTPAGNVSMPVRTQFGYHLIKVNDKLPAEGKKQVAHIIIRIGDRYSAKDTASAVKKIGELYDRLQAGADFAELAAEYSDDPVSGAKGGDLGTGRLLPEMEAYKIKLKNQEYSRPFTTAYGWHILKVTDVEPIKPFDEAKGELKQRISRDSRSQVSREALLERIKRENNFVFESANFDAFKATLDDNFPRGSWHPDTTKAEMYALPLIRLGTDRILTINDFIEFYKRARNRNARQTPDQAAETLRKEFVEKELLRYEEERLPEKNPEFRHLVGEYRDGILLFTLMEQKVWKKAVEDTTGLKAYYESHTGDFNADEMIDVKEYRTKEKSVIDEVDKLLAQRLPEATIDSLINSESALKLRITMQSYEKGKNDPGTDLFTKPEEYRTPILEQDGFYKILILKKKYPAGIKPFEKARSEAITRYQDYLEAQWLAELAQKYPVEINEDVFAKLFK
jgi:peptidyl-prolyl cis-trans isomerase SurA